MKIKYWRDAAGIEADYVLDIVQHYIPIEVKWSNTLKPKNEYPQADHGYIICRI